MLYHLFNKIKSVMFKKKFDNVNGETRICRVCDVEFYTKKTTYICSKCQCKKVNDYRKQKLADGRLTLKAPYPYKKLNNNYKSNFDKLKSKIHKMKERHEWQAYFKERLDEVLNDALLMTWINDRRDNETKKEKTIKSRNVIKQQTPDTRGHYEY